MCVCVCKHLRYRLNYAAVSQPAIGAGQPGSHPGPDRAKQQAGKQNEPQWQCKQTTERPHHNHTAACHLRRCTWLSARRGGKEGWREGKQWREMERKGGKRREDRWGGKGRDAKVGKRKEEGGKEEGQQGEESWQERQSAVKKVWKDCRGRRRAG